MESRPAKTLGYEVGCRSFDSGVGAQYPAGGRRTRRKSHGSVRLPLAIPSVGESRGRLPWGRPRASPNREHDKDEEVGLFPWVLNTSSKVSWEPVVASLAIQSGAVLLHEFSELQGSRCCRPSSPRAWRWKVLSQLSRMKRQISCRTFRATRDAWLWVCVPTREAFRTVQHSAGMHLLSVGTRTKCP